MNCSSTTWLEFSKIHKQNNVSFLTMNARSLANKFSEFVAHLSSLKCKKIFILVTETWFSPNNDATFELPGYNSFNFYRNGKGDGLKLYVLNSITTHETNHNFSNSCEVVMVASDIPGFGRTNILGVYRPPQNSTINFIRELDDFFVLNGTKRCILMGDINLNLLDVDCNTTQAYVNLFESFGFVSEISLSTYCCPVNMVDTSCLDHIIHNFDLESSSYILKPNLSDHYAVVSLFKMKNSLETFTNRFRNYSQANIETFERQVETEFCNFAGFDHDIDKFASNINLFLYGLMDKYFPIKTKTVTLNRLRTPWITNDIRDCITKKHRWHRLAKDKIITMASYKNYCNSLRNLIRKAEREYNLNELGMLGANMKKNWKLLNKLLNKKTKNIADQFNINNTLCSNPQLISEAFNDYFIESPQIVQNNVVYTPLNFSHLVPRSSNSMYFSPCSEIELENEILAIKKRGNIRDISGKFLRLCSVPVSKILYRLFNLCIEKGHFPLVYKVARVTPVYKKGSRSEISNHRPISVLPCISKVFESIIYKRIQNYFISKGFLNKNQYGFRKKLNTEMAIFSLIDRMQIAFEDKCFGICIFLDYSKCFDIMCRYILFSKLEGYGVRGKPLQLIRSYFDGREQYVIYSDKKSTLRSQNLGVVQGSKCGPLYYDIYTSDFSNLCEEGEFLMFADDTCLLYTGHNLGDLTEKVNERLKTIFHWCCYNKLSLNPSKCSYMLFTNKNVPFDPIIKINDNPITRSRVFKYLGVYVDDKLKYQKQIDTLCTKTSRLCGVSYRLQGHLDMRAAKNVYFSCIYSVLTYCICIFGGVFQNSQRGKRLISLHNKSVKNLFCKFCLSGGCIFKQMKLLKLIDIHKLYVCIYMYKMISLNEVPTLQKNMNLQYPSHNYETRIRSNPIVPFPRVITLEINYKYQCTKIWGEIPDYMKALSSLKIFKKTLTDYFLSKY